MASDGSAGAATTAGTGTAALKDFREKGAHENHPFFSYYGMLVG